MDGFSSGVVTRQRAPEDERTARMRVRAAAQAASGAGSSGIFSIVGVPNQNSGGIGTASRSSSSSQTFPVGFDDNAEGANVMEKEDDAELGGVGSEVVSRSSAKRVRRAARLTRPKKSRFKLSGGASGGDDAGDWLAYRLTTMRTRFSDDPSEQAAYPLGVTEWEVAWQHPITKAEAGCSWMTLKHIAERHMDWLIADWVQHGSRTEIAYCHGSFDPSSVNQAPDPQRLIEWEAWQAVHRKREGARISAAGVPFKLLPA